MDVAVDEEIAFPLKVMVRALRVAPPALFAATVMFAMLSTEDFTRLVWLPSAVALGVSVVRRTVIVLPVTGVPESVAATFEPTVSAVMALEVAMPKVDVELSVAAPEL